MLSYSNFRIKTNLSQVSFEIGTQTSQPRSYFILIVMWNNHDLSLWFRRKMSAGY